MRKFTFSLNRAKPAILMMAFTIFTFVAFGQVKKSAIGGASQSLELNPSKQISGYDNLKAQGVNPLNTVKGKQVTANYSSNNSYQEISQNNYVPNIFGNQNTAQRSGGCFIPVDASYTAVPRNDDGSYGPLNLGFNFNLYGTNYSQVYINTNGNLTFNGAVYSYSSSGFPYGTPMVAPLWGDVDTRNGGQIYYKLTGSHLIVTWNGVRYYPSSSGLINTFQAIIGTNADALTGFGQNVSLRYADMQWTTGNASGGSGGFGGIPATVGINKGNSVNYVQIGRFNQNNSSYDGPGGAHDGVNYLDNQCVSFNVSNANNIPPSITGLPANNTVNLSCGQTVNLSMVAIAPEVNQNVTVSVNMGGMCNATSSVNGGNVNISLTAAQCNSGTNTITITATDNGNPVETTVQTITVNVANCCQLAIAGTVSDATCSNAFDGGVNLTASGASGQATYIWSNGSTAEDLSGVSPGTYSVTATDAMGCTDNATFTIGYNDNIMPNVVTTGVTVQLDASGNGSTTAAAVDNGSFDACGIASMSLSNTSFTCANVGPNTVTLTVTDVNGNSSSATATVTVEDNVGPMAMAQGTVVQLDASGNGTITVADINNGSSDACGVAGVSLNNTSFNCSNVGANTVVLTVMDVNGNSSSASATVMVEDNVAPVAMCQAVSVTLANGMASVTPMDVDNGSNDACGIASMTLSEDTWTCGDIGNHTVTLTVTDNNGNVSSCNAVVTVIGEVPTCSIASIPTSSTYTGGVSTTLYIGYGAQSTTLSCTPTGGSSFTYAWTGSNLSSSTSSNPVFTPTSEGIYNFSVLVTNNNGCETTCSISICVRDIRVYSKKGKLQKGKVYLCHVPPGNNNNPQTLSVSVNAIASHLSNHSGDALGTCNSSCGTVGNSSKTGEMFTDEFEGQDVDVILYPNPSTDHFSVMVESEMEEMITIEVYDMAGNIVERTEGQFTYHEIEMGRNLASGIYMVVITQGNYRKVLRASMTK